MATHRPPSSVGLASQSETNLDFDNHSGLEQQTQLMLNQAIGLAQDFLVEIASAPNFFNIFEIAFGQNFDTTLVEALQQQWLTHTFDGFSTLEIQAAADINQAQGAFSVTTGKIYLSQDFLFQPNITPADIANVLLEELGHAIDVRINNIDASGDEGAIFAALVQGKVLDAPTLQNLKAEDDTAIVTLDGQQIQIEQANNQVTLSGTILWTDGQGKKHAVRESTVKIWDDEGSDYDELVTIVTTDQSGNYSATFDNDDGWLSGNRDIYIEVLADGPKHFVRGNSKANGTVSVFSKTLDGIPDGVNSLPLTINNKTETEKAFSVSDVLYIGSKFAETVRGTPQTVKTYLQGKGSSFGIDSKAIAIGLNDVWDWDVILHEYGHFLAEEDHFDHSTGGPHSAGQSNLTESRGKDAAIKLAWSEGVATYLSIAAQQVAQAQGILPSILNAGDTKYTNGTLSYDLETEDATTSKGETDELSVARILLDLADSTKDRFRHGLKDEVSLGHKGLYDIFKAIPPLDRLDDLWNHFHDSSLTDRQLANIGAIFEEYNVSPAPQNGIYSYFPNSEESAPPTFHWWAGNNHANDEFQVIIFNNTFKRVAISPKIEDVTQWTMTPKQWAQLKEQPGQYYFVVTGSDTDNSPKTGAYWSGAYDFTVLKKSPPLEDIPADWSPLYDWPPSEDWTPRVGGDWTPPEWKTDTTAPLENPNQDRLTRHAESSSLVGDGIVDDLLTGASSNDQTSDSGTSEPLGQRSSPMIAAPITPNDVLNQPISIGSNEVGRNGQGSGFPGVDPDFLANSQQPLLSSSLSIRQELLISG